MKKLIIILTALLPMALLAGDGDKGNKQAEKISINIHTGKNGVVELSGLNGKDLKALQTKINKALKDVDITISDGKENHKLHFTAELKMD
jgi:ribosomal protein S3